jgi:hypothetical protein
MRGTPSQPPRKLGSAAGQTATTHAPPNISWRGCPTPRFHSGRSAHPAGAARAASAVGFVALEEAQSFECSTRRSAALLSPAVSDDSCHRFFLLAAGHRFRGASPRSPAQRCRYLEPARPPRHQRGRLRRLRRGRSTDTLRFSPSSPRRDRPDTQQRQRAPQSSPQQSGSCLRARKWEREREGWRLAQHGQCGERELSTNSVARPWKLHAPSSSGWSTFTPSSSIACLMAAKSPPRAASKTRTNTASSRPNSVAADSGIASSILRWRRRRVGV